jgi:hypothetical protein
MTSEERAQASRRNDARSRWPRTAAGKARSVGNTLKHGLRARKLVLLQGEDATEFRRFARALEAELMPAGRLQADLVSGSRSPPGARGARTSSRRASSPAISRASAGPIPTRAPRWLSA